MAESLDPQSRAHPRHLLHDRSLQPRAEIKFEGGLVAVVVLLFFAVIFIIGCLVWFCIGIRKEAKVDRQRRLDRQMEEAAKFRENIHQPLQMRIDDYNVPAPGSQPAGKEYHSEHMVPPAAVAGAPR
jgi:hypothetical protein